MLTTRCPSCNTVFRIRAEQLNQRGGRVRCGHCHTAFLALSTLEEMPEDADMGAAAPASAAPVTPPVAVAPAVEAAAPDFDLPPATAATPPQDTPSGDVDREAEAFAALTQLTPPLVPLDDGRIEPGLSEAPLAYEVPEFEIPLDDDPEPREEAPADVEEEEAVELTGLEPELDEEEGTAAATSHEAAADAAPPNLLHGDGDALANVLEQMSDEDNAPRRENLADPQTVFLDDAVLLPPAQPRHAARWAAGAVALLLLAALQTVYLFRTEIAREMPQWRPAMAEACAALGCDLPYPARAEDILVEATDLNPDSAQSGRYTLTVTLRNRARFMQSWPHLELTLTDRFDRAIARRVLTPREWLPAGMAQSPAFGPLGEITAQVGFGTELPAAGYRLYAFYP